MDGTFKVVREPFVQLFSVHAFIRRDQCEKQVPLAFVVMNRRSTPDYQAALQAVIDALPSPPGCEDHHHRLREGHLERLPTGFPGGPGSRLWLPLGPGCGASAWRSGPYHRIQGQGWPPTWPAAEADRPAVPAAVWNPSSLRSSRGCGPDTWRWQAVHSLRLCALQLARVKCAVNWSMVSLQPTRPDQQWHWGMASSPQQPRPWERSTLPLHRPPPWWNHSCPPPGPADPRTAPPSQPEVNVHHLTTEDDHCLGGVRARTPVCWPAAA